MTMRSSPVRDIKRAQKESLFSQTITNLFRNVQRDDSRFSGLLISRVTLSSDYGLCFVYFYTPDGKDAFHALMGDLILYKPSLRKALAQELNQRRTPDLIFRFDETVEKQARVEEIFERIKKDLA